MYYAKTINYFGCKNYKSSIRYDSNLFIKLNNKIRMLQNFILKASLNSRRLTINLIILYLPQFNISYNFGLFKPYISLSPF